MELMGARARLLCLRIPAPISPNCCFSEPQSPRMCSGSDISTFLRVGTIIIEGENAFEGLTQHLHLVRGL